DGVLVLHDIDSGGTGSGAGAGIFDGAFTGAIQGRTCAERDRQHRGCTQRAPPAGPSRGEARGSFHIAIVLHENSGGNPAPVDFWSAIFSPVPKPAERPPPGARSAPASGCRAAGRSRS